MENGHGIMPDLLAALPPHPLLVKYSTEVVIEQGNILVPSQVKGRPIEVQWPAESGDLYTLLLLDVDAPSREEPSLRSVLHWLVVNIPENGIDKGDTIAEFIGAGPGRDTGLHRYAMLVYKQPGQVAVKMDKITNRSFVGRPKVSRWFWLSLKSDIFGFFALVSIE